MVYLGVAVTTAITIESFYEVWDSGLAATKFNDPQGCLVGTPNANLVDLWGG